VKGVGQERNFASGERRAVAANHFPNGRISSPSVHSPLR
jgi:hypothetical protein